MEMCGVAKAVWEGKSGFVGLILPYFVVFYFIIIFLIFWFVVVVRGMVEMDLQRCRIVESMVRVVWGQMDNVQMFELLALYSSFLLRSFFFFKLFLMVFFCGRMMFLGGEEVSEAREK